MATIKDDYLKDMAKRVLLINTNNGWTSLSDDDWEDPERMAAQIANIHGEASEALEAIAKGDYENFQEELADVMIRVLHIVAGMDIPIKDVIDAKLKKNAMRSWRHGGKRI